MSAKSYGRILGANDRLNIAVIGCMRRANALRGSFGELKDQLHIEAVCDVIRERREKYAASLEEVMGLLPDTMLMEVEGALVPLDQSFMALLVERVEASRIPIPKCLVAEVLAGLGWEGPPSLPADALAVPIPDGVTAVLVQKDSLVLEARR